MSHILESPDSNSRQVHASITAAIDDLAAASRHQPRSYRDDPLLAYAFDAGPRHRFAAHDVERFVSDLELRNDLRPVVNRDRWSAWADDIAKELGPDHPATLTTRNNLASWTGDAGDTVAARDQFAALLPDMRRVLGPDHPATLTTRNNLASWTGKAGDTVAARDQFAALLPDHQRVLGPDHPDTLTTRNNLAYWTWLAE